MRRFPVLAAGLLLAASAAGIAGGDDPFLSCGNLAPFVPACGACCEIFEGDADAGANLLGYEGRLDIRLKEVGQNNSWTWSCWALLLPRLPATAASEEQDFLGGCEGPFETGHLRARDLVRLDCFVFPLGVPTIVGPVEPVPFGPYGCRVDLPSP